MLCCLGKDAMDNHQRTLILKRLPVHRALLLGESVTANTIAANTITLLSKDFDGRTAIDIILMKKNASPVPADVVSALIISSLHFDEHGNPMNCVTWGKVLQSDDDVIVTAVEMVLSNLRENVQALANSKDEVGRICKDIAGPRNKKALASRLLLYKRYEINEGPPVYRSSKNIVVFAKDHGCAGDPVVALKFLRDRVAFLNEIESRENSGFDRKYVLAILSYFDGNEHSAAERSFRRDAISKGYQEYPHCVVLEAAEKSLQHILDGSHPKLSLFHLVRPNQEEPEGDDDMMGVRFAMKSVTSCLEHIHAKGYIHGDIRPLNILLVGSEMKMTNLEHSVNYHKVELAGKRLSSDYKTRQQQGIETLSAPGNVSPEMLWMDVIGMVRLRVSTDSHSASYCRVAHSSQDMWGLGTLLYLMCTGHTLFHCSTEGKIVEQDDMQNLFNWTNDIKRRKLRNIPGRLERDLLARLLHKDPNKRPTAAEVLQHPYISEKKFSRPGSAPVLYNVFLSYRNLVDDTNANLLYEALQARGLTVWYDAKDIYPGANRITSMCGGMITSAVFVVLCSRQGLSADIATSMKIQSMTADSDSDLLLMLCRLAEELKEHGVLHNIVPVLIGDAGEDGSFGNYIVDKCHPENVPDVVVKAVELEVADVLEEMGWGVPLLPPQSVKNILESITGDQNAVCFDGELMECVNRTADAIMRIVQSTIND